MLQSSSRAYQMWMMVTAAYERIHVRCTCNINTFFEILWNQLLFLNTYVQLQLQKVVQEKKKQNTL